MADYVKGNFLTGREFEGMDDLNAQAIRWLETVANVRVHATTGHRPVDLLASEKPKLTPIETVRPYALVERQTRRVMAESMVSFGTSRYSVPPRYVGQSVSVSCERRENRRAQRRSDRRRARGGDAAGLQRDAEGAPGRIVEACCTAHAAAAAQLAAELRAAGGGDAAAMVRAIV